MPIIIFRTSVEKKSEAKKIIKILMEQHPKYNINFDLEDCDNILRIEGKNIQEKIIIEQLSSQGFEVKRL